MTFDYDPRVGPGADFHVDPQTLHGKRAIENASILCYEANRGYCLALGDDSFKHWSKAADWQLDSNLDGVRHLLKHPKSTPEDSHENWLAKKEGDGWVVGPIKDVEKKTHPCMVPYDKLPADQRLKDVVFQATARAALYVYGLRFASRHAEPRVFQDAQKTWWRCSDPVLDYGMYLVTGRMHMIAFEATSLLAVAQGVRVTDQHKVRNRVLAHQLTCAMGARGAEDAYGVWTATRWPEEATPWCEFSRRQRAHWFVLYAIAHAVMELEGVVVRATTKDGWWAAEDGTEDAIQVTVSSNALARAADDET